VYFPKLKSSSSFSGDMASPGFAEKS